MVRRGGVLVSADLQAVVAVLAFASLLAWVNLKAGTRHWTGVIMAWVSLLLLLACICVLAWLTYGMVFRG